MSEKIANMYNLVRKAQNSRNEKKRQEIVKTLLNDYDKDLFLNSLNSKIKIDTMSEEEREVSNYINNIIGGGFLIPPDIETEIRQLRRKGINLENLINVELVESNTGSRVYELGAEYTPLSTVDDFGEIPEVDLDDLIEVNFELVKKACIVNVKESVFKDSDETLIDWIKNWASKKGKATRNHMIIQKLAEITTGKEIEVTDVDTLRNGILANLDDQYKENATVLVNYAGYDYFDKLTDDSGNKILEANEKNSKEKLLFGLYPMIVLPDKLIINNTGNISIFIGALKETIVLFDRQKPVIDIAKSYKFIQDYVSMKYIERLDVEEIDPNATIKISFKVGA